MFFVGLVVNYDLFIFTDFLFFKQKTAYEMRISDWSSDVCSSDLLSTQHAEEVDHATLKEAVIEEIVKPVIPAAMISAETRYLINPTGRFVIGGPHGDCGLTGRKIIVDTYGGIGRHGGGAVSGKIGRASCRERVCQYVLIPVVGVSLKKKK